MFIETKRLGREVNDYHWALVNASFIGHENIARVLLGRGTDNYASVLRASEWNGHKSIIMLIWEGMN